MEERSLLHVTTLPGLMAIDIVAVEISGIADKMFLIYHVTSHDHLLKGLCDLWFEVSHSKSPFCLV